MAEQRSYRDEDDLRRMWEVLCAVRQAAGSPAPHPSGLLWTFLMITCHLDPAGHVRLWFEGRELAAYALLDEDGVLDFQVAPGASLADLGSEALSWACSRLAELHALDEGRWTSRLSCSAAESDPDRIALLAGARFEPGPDQGEIGLVLDFADEVCAAEPPAGWEVRSVSGEEEAGRRATAQRLAWHPWSVGDITEADYRRLMRLPGYRPELDVAAVNGDGEFGSSANAWLDPLTRMGDLGPVGTVPAFRREGLARAVLAEALRRLHERGMRQVSVSTQPSNAPALGLYAGLGFRPVSTYRVYVREAHTV